MVVDENLVECELKVKKSLCGFNQASENRFDLLKLVYKGGFDINLNVTFMYLQKRIGYFNLCL